MNHHLFHFILKIKILVARIKYGKPMIIRYEGPAPKNWTPPKSVTDSQLLVVSGGGGGKLP